MKKGTETAAASQNNNNRAQANENESIAFETASRFVKGGLSGLLSGAVLQPLQVIKTSMQVSRRPYVPPVHEAEATVEKNMTEAK